MNKTQLTRLFKKTWHFIWHEDSVLSWLVNIVLAFVLIKFIVYPLLAAFLGTSFPIVAVVSPSMEHRESFELWWGDFGSWYEKNNITKADFKKFPLKNGFDKGDIIILRSAKNIEIGDVVVFKSHREQPRPDPIIHRVVKTDSRFQTKGDNNARQINECSDGCLDETDIRAEQIFGKAMLRIPLLGWVKILFVDYIGAPYCSATKNVWPCGGI